MIYFPLKYKLYEIQTAHKYPLMGWNKLHVVKKYMLPVMECAMQDPEVPLALVSTFTCNTVGAYFACLTISKKFVHVHVHVQL